MPFVTRKVTNRYAFGLCTVSPGDCKVSLALLDWSVTIALLSDII
jgi:hypothetical protein